MGGKVEEGSLILLDVSIYDEGTGELVMTTDEEEAERHGRRLSEKGPLLVQVGSDDIFRPVMEALVGMKEGSSGEIVVKPKDAFGEYDEGKREVFTERRLRREGIDPSKREVGDTVELRGRRGVVRSMTGGRVVIDFNHPLAGKTLRVRFRVVRVLSEDAEVVRAVVADAFGVYPDEIEVDLKGEVATVKLCPAAFMRRDSLARKYKALSKIMRLLKSVRKVVFVEEFEIPERSEPQGDLAEP
ncbi:MAG: hypothetical protein DRO06_01715 [Thermoproteota archaeon]|nr:MAG: hypothetical protein DRO06_01715 [Candidatus Korarchaeota archaeon]